jgi:hypothetical protein
MGVGLAAAHPVSLASPARHFMNSYFDRTATALWDGHWDTIVHTRNANDTERLHLEAAILCKFGKSLSLRGSAETVRMVLAAARIDAETREAQRMTRMRSAQLPRKNDDGIRTGIAAAALAAPPDNDDAAFDAAA